MVDFVKIGNSQDISISKSLIEQAHPDGEDLEFKLVNQGILITHSKKPRDGWEKSIEKRLADADKEEQTDKEWLDATLISNNELDW